MVTKWILLPFLWQVPLKIILERSKKLKTQSKHHLKPWSWTSLGRVASKTLHEGTVSSPGAQYCFKVQRLIDPYQYSGPGRAAFYNSCLFLSCFGEAVLNKSAMEIRSAKRRHITYTRWIQSSSYAWKSANNDISCRKKMNYIIWLVFQAVLNTI